MGIQMMSRAQSFTAAALSGKFLTWTSPTLDESGAAMTPDGYYVYAGQNSEDYADQGLGPQDTASTSNSYTWSNVLFLSGTWYFWVRAWEGSGSTLRYSELLSLGAL